MKESMKSFWLKFKNPEVSRSILTAFIISIIVPFILPLIADIIFGVNPDKPTIGWNLNQDSRIPIFLEVSIAEVSLLLVIIRIIPFIIFGYINGLIFKKIFLKKSIIGNAYLIISSIIFYFIIMKPMFKFFIFLDSIDKIHFIFSLFDFFSF